jgi:hypothetical protein
MKYNQNEKLIYPIERDTQKDDYKVNKTIENRVRNLEQKIVNLLIDLNNSGNMSARLGSTSKNMDKK